MHQFEATSYGSNGHDVFRLPYPQSDPVPEVAENDKAVLGCTFFKYLEVLFQGKNRNQPETKRGRQNCFHSCRTARLWSYLLLSCMPDCASVSPQLPARQLSPPAWCTLCQILLLEREVKAAALLMPLPFCHRLVFKAV